MTIISKRTLYSGIGLISLVAMAGSLYFSEVEDLTPCTLCWYQRILMYPLFIMALVGLRRRDPMFPRYVLPLSAIGMVLAGYHYSLQMFEPAALNSFINCSRGSISCSVIDVSFYGFITIPLLSFIAFTLITLAALLSLRVDRWK